MIDTFENFNDFVYFDFTHNMDNFGLSYFCFCILDYNRNLQILAYGFSRHEDFEAHE